MQSKEQLLQQATEWNKTKGYSKVTALLTDKILEEYQDVDLYTEIAQAYLKENNYKLFHNAANKAYLINTENSKANYYKGLSFYFNDEKDKAIELFKKSIQLDPNYSLPYNSLGGIYGERKFYREAIEAFTKAIRIEPAYNYYFNRASVYYDLEEYGRALKDYEKTIELSPTDGDSFASTAKEKISHINKQLNIFDNNTTITNLVGDIKKILLHQDDCITHYTGLSIAKKLILNREKSSFRLSEGSFLNDSSEGRELFEFLPPIGKAIPSANKAQFEPFAKRPFIGSFVPKSRHDDLTLWRMYGKENMKEAEGCAITIETKKLLDGIKEQLVLTNDVTKAEDIDEDLSFYRVAYRQKGKNNSFTIPGSENVDEEKLNDLMNKLHEVVRAVYEKEAVVEDYENTKEDIKYILMQLNSIAYLFKSAAYEYERELRLVVKGNRFVKHVDLESTPPKVYIELVDITSMITQITLGPKVEKKDEWASAFFYSLSEGRRLPPEIFISHLPFK